MVATICLLMRFQLTAARRRLGLSIARIDLPVIVSTHSRPEAAGQCLGNLVHLIACFNSQPPGGGWTPDEIPAKSVITVSTHSRPEAAGFLLRTGLTCSRAFQLTAARRRLVAKGLGIGGDDPVSTHSRPEAAGHCPVAESYPRGNVSTHSRPEAAGAASSPAPAAMLVSTHSRPEAAGANKDTLAVCIEQFQLTAARRRLGSSEVFAQ